MFWPNSDLTTPPPNSSRKTLCVTASIMPELQNLTLLDNIWNCVCIQHQATDKGVVAYMQLPRNILWKLAQNKKNSINFFFSLSNEV